MVTNMKTLNEIEEDFIYLGEFKNPKEVIDKLIEEHYYSLLETEFYCHNGKLDYDIVEDILNQKIGVYKNNQYYLIEEF